MRGDLEVKGLQTQVLRRVAASATRFEVGEPLHSTSTLSGGVASATTFVLAAADTPVIGTHRFGGVAIQGALPYKTGTLVAQNRLCACPIPYAGILRGRAETVASVDTDSELLGIIGDVTLIDYSASGASDGGELYTIKEVASADTSGLEIVGGNPAKSTLDVFVDGDAYRHDRS